MEEENPIYFSHLYLSKHIIRCPILLAALGRRKKKEI